jgi:DNA-binding MarR family transcriptional regulator
MPTTSPKPAPKPSGQEPSLADATLALLAASRALVGVAARSLADIDGTITLPQYRALVLLAIRGDQNVGGLADALDIHPSTTTRLCNRLVAKGLVERTTSEGNRREVTVALTADGDALVRAVAAKRRAEVRRIVTRLDPDARRALVDAFTTFADAAGEAPDDAWKLGWAA